ncbi:MAG: nitronate monooxygenase [Cytophagaceae bacterium]|nr:nitronate monooxygenase [Cytophagaceae bacterium]
MSNRITSLFSIQYPIIQAGMVWCSGWKLASAVSNSGGLGLIGAGSMTPELLLYHLNQMELHTTRPYGVNVPLLYSNIEAHIQVIETSPVPIVFTSAGNPALYTARLKAAGKTVVHVVSSAAFAEKAARAGVDAVVAEGVEAGGHNGKEETTTLCLIPLVKAAVSIPVIAAGGIASGRAMAAVIALGADGVQIGSAFAVAKESSAHERFKTAVLQSKEGDTVLTLKELAPVRLLKNNFYDEIKNAYTQHVGIEALRALLGKGRSKKGIFEGNLDEGELEIGQVAAQLKDEPTAEEIIHRILQEYRLTIDSIPYF